MRARLNLLTAGVTLLVVIAFVVPLGFLVRQQADQRGRLEAERTARTLAAVIVPAAIGAGGEFEPADISGLIGPVPEGSVIILSDGQRLGPGDPDLALIDEVQAARSSLSAYRSDGGFGLAIPVVTGSGTTVVYSSVPATDLNRGVTRAWALLAALGMGLVAAALFASDRLGRGVVGPSQRIATAAEQLGAGKLETRVEEEGPEELVAIAVAFNQLAGRIRGLLAEEREEVADLSHRLRTPLAALRLQVEQMESSDERTALIEKVDRLRHAVDELIHEARMSPESQRSNCDVVAVMNSRLEFWRVLAREQERNLHVDVADAEAPVAISESEIAAAFDAIIGNVFSHTEAGVGFGVIIRVLDGRVEVEVADGGGGFSAGFDPVERGSSGAGSSGLGLDIVRRLARNADGSMRLGSSHSGGARVVLELPLQTRTED
ncbi:MAG: HAMP domain-containing sensor histidine kinase [Acidimicrobiia bacterium]